MLAKEGGSLGPLSGVHSAVGEARGKPEPVRSAAGVSCHYFDDILPKLGSVRLSLDLSHCHRHSEERSWRIAPIRGFTGTFTVP